MKKTVSMKKKVLAIAASLMITAGAVTVSAFSASASNEFIGGNMPSSDAVYTDTSMKNTEASEITISIETPDLNVQLNESAELYVQVDNCPYDGNYNIDLIDKDENGITYIKSLGWTDSGDEFEDSISYGVLYSVKGVKLGKGTFTIQVKDAETDEIINQKSFTITVGAEN